jgi:molybdopterin/thiamine biosynthesis adenylyltransferase/rhodanese-related sulfurtransferase
MDTSTRYLRQTTLPGFGATGQDALGSARVLVIGAGGLGSSVVPALAAAGVGTIGIIDDDTVEVSNLHRQYLHGEADVGRNKVDSAVGTVAALNSSVTVVPHNERLTSANALEIFAGYSLVIDGSDNFPTRYLANDAAALTGIPLVWGAVSQYAGQAGVCWAANGPQYRDLFPTPPPPGTVLSCADGGVLPTVCAVIGAILATETIKLLTGIGDPLLGRVTTFNALTGSFREIQYNRDTTAAPITELIDYEVFCGVAPRSDTVTATELAAELAPGITVAGTTVPGTTPISTAPASTAPKSTTPSSTTPASTTPVSTTQTARPPVSPQHPVRLLDVREPWEVQVAHLTGAMVIPLGSLGAELEQGIAELDPSQPVVVFCHHGVRSATALALLRAHGYTAARHLEGGIDAWSRAVDPAIARY